MTTTLTAPAPVLFAGVHQLFDGYNITELQVQDVLGDGTTFTAYDGTGNWIELPLNDDDASCINGMDWEFQLDNVLGLVFEKVGEYTEVGGSITRQGNTFTFNGTVTRSIIA